MRTLSAFIGLMLIAAIPATAEEQPRIQIFGGYSYMNSPQEFSLNPASFDLYTVKETANGGTHQNGLDVSVAVNLTKNLALVADASTHFNDRNIVRMEFALPDYTGQIWETAQSTTYSFLFGPQIHFLGAKKIDPFGRALFGISKINRETTITQSYTGIDGRSHVSSLQETLLNTGFAFAIGGGIDWRCSKSYSIRLLQADYLRAKKEFTYAWPFYDGLSWIGKDSMTNNFRISAGIVFNIGRR